MLEQVEKLKSCEMKEECMWMVEEESRMKNDEGWWFQAVDGFWLWTEKLTDICECRVAFETENLFPFFHSFKLVSTFETSKQRSKQSQTLLNDIVLQTFQNNLHLSCLIFLPLSNVSQFLEAQSSLKVPITIGVIFYM